MLCRPLTLEPISGEVNCYDKMRLDGKRIRGPRKDRTIFSKIQLFRLERYVIVEYVILLGCLNLTAVKMISG